MRGIHRWSVNSPQRGPVTRKMFPFDDLIMVVQISWRVLRRYVSAGGWLSSLAVVAFMFLYVGSLAATNIWLGVWADDPTDDLESARIKTRFRLSVYSILGVGQSMCRARFLSFARSKLRLCSGNHRTGYFSNLACDWLSIVWDYSEQETKKGPRPR